MQELNKEKQHGSKPYDAKAIFEAITKASLAIDTKASFEAIDTKASFEASMPKGPLKLFS
jgi:hypothetical protein